jgi:indolepyruvate ferredoxin oxidoreductase, beta subunit
MNYDLFLVGVGGQGVLTIGEILVSVATSQKVPVSFYPSKGMAQRGGFVKGQLRFGREMSGPSIREGGADLVIAMELSEATKAIRYIRAGGDFILFADIWSPIEVLLGKAPYPKAAQVEQLVRAAGANLISVSPDELTTAGVKMLAANLFLLGVALGHTSLRNVIDPKIVDEAVQMRWKKAAEKNHMAFMAGMNFIGQTENIQEKRG